jgi:hypothetical protein
VQPPSFTISEIIADLLVAVANAQDKAIDVLAFQPLQLVFQKRPVPHAGHWLGPVVDYRLQPFPQTTG